MVEQSLSIKPDNFIAEDEPDILTDEEKREAIEHAIIQKREHYAWKLKDRTIPISDEEIKKRMSEIDWLKEIDSKKVITTANSIKHQNLWHEEQRRLEVQLKEQAQEELKKRCDARYMFRMMKWTSREVFGKELIVANWNLPLIKSICFFLSRDERFETELNYSFKKGLMIRGVSGLGKTHLVRCVEHNELNPIKFLSMLEISDDVKEHGEYRMEMDGNKILYLDDVGTEEATIKHFGTSISFFKNFIELVYLKNSGRSFNQLMISTNNNFAEIEQKYGFRVRSRMKEMFNVVDVNGTDLRS